MDHTQSKSQTHADFTLGDKVTRNSIPHCRLKSLQYVDLRLDTATQKSFTSADLQVCTFAKFYDKIISPAGLTIYKNQKIYILLLIIVAAVCTTYKISCLSHALDDLIHWEACHGFEGKLGCSSNITLDSHYSHPYHHVPRVVFLNKTSSRRAKGRMMELNPTPFSDITQTYPFADSHDPEVYGSMELRIFPQHEANKNCIPMSRWQNTCHPTCNNFHENSMINSLITDNIFLIETRGFWRDIWVLESTRPYTSIRCRERKVVLKTMRYEHEWYLFIPETS